MKTPLLMPGETVCGMEGIIKGHGTEQTGSLITSTVFGYPQKIDNLIIVNPLFPSKYTPEVGDVIIGRVEEVYNKKWKLWANSKFDCTLSLSSMNLPGVAQRRKSEEDEMNMRNFFDINELIVCEVQKVNKSGSANLHTRNEKYGKLKNGVLIEVCPSHIDQMTSRFIKSTNIELIAGANGLIWVSPAEEKLDCYRAVINLKEKILHLVNGNASINLDSILKDF